MDNRSDLLIYLKLNAQKIFLLLAIFSYFLSFPASAAIVLWPTNLVIENNQKSTILRLENRGNEPVVMQMRIYSWSQVNGQDKLTEQQQIIGSPPMMNIGAGKQQIIRIINKGPVAEGQELTYRLVLDEIPTKNKAQQGVNFQMRYSLPLFVYGSGLKHNILPDDIYKHLTWSWVNEKGQKWLEFSNQTPNHIHLSRINLQQPSGNFPSSYILPQSVIRIAIDNQVSEPKTVTAILNGEKEYTINKK